jgi:hypothetical protein
MPKSERVSHHVRSARIKELNDQLRTTLTGGRVMMSSGVEVQGAAFVATAAGALKSFTAFDKDNDPHGEHDFGQFEVDSHRLFFKIDYYSPDMTQGSDDPADPAKTVRILTLMLAEEY